MTSTELKNLNQAKIDYLKKLDGCSLDIDKKSSAYIASLFFFKVVKKHDMKMAIEQADKHVWRWTPWYGPSPSGSLPTQAHGTTEKKEISSNWVKRQQQHNSIRKRFRKAHFTPPQSLDQQYDVFINELENRLKRTNPKNAWEEAGWSIIASRDKN